MKTLITRSDDLGSSRAANQAIRNAVDAGFIRNVSIMAPGPYVEEAARMLAHRQEVCFGLHITLNAEWDRIKWGPVLPVPNVRTLVDKDGFFLQDPVLFTEHTPSLEEVMQEINAQLDKLTRLGFPISYVDSHMLAERFVAGLPEAIDAWIAEKGLVNHNFFYNLFPQNDSVASTPGLFGQVLSTLGDGQYFFLSHPALYGEEMAACGNAQVDGEELARGRDAEAKFVADPQTRITAERFGFRCIRYDEAVPGETWGWQG